MNAIDYRNALFERGIRAMRGQALEASEKRILGTKEVAAYLGVCNVTASKIMKESGKVIRLGNRLLISEKNLQDYLASLEGKL